MSIIKTGRKAVDIATAQKAFPAIVGMLVLMLFFPQSGFYSAYNLIDLLNSTSILLILAFGVTLTVISGGCDLSIGGILAVSGVIAIQLMNVLPMWLAIAVTLLTGAFMGFVNGFLVVQQKTEPFIITLGTGLLLTGVAQQLTDARPIVCNNPHFVELAHGRLLFFIPNLVMVMLVVFLLTHLLMRYTQFGRNCYAIGGDYEVAMNSGINVVKTKWLTFVICGFLSALAGIMLSAKLNSGSSIYGESSALVVNCGVVVGGTSFAGGVGGIPQSALGLLVFGILANAMNMLGIQSYIQILLQGGVIVGIIWLDCFTNKRKRESV